MRHDRWLRLVLSEHVTGSSRDDRLPESATLTRLDGRNDRARLGLEDNATFGKLGHRRVDVLDDPGGLGELSRALTGALGDVEAGAAVSYSRSPLACTCGVSPGFSL
jgi:hypothetical protein